MNRSELLIIQHSVGVSESKKEKKGIFAECCLGLWGDYNLQRGVLYKGIFSKAFWGYLQVNTNIPTHK